MNGSKAKDGEMTLPIDPATAAGDVTVTFIGRIRSPWLEPRDCPKNLREARERGGDARVEVDPHYRAGLDGLDAFSRVILLYWMDRARRDLIVQRPRHRNAPAATFTLRSPVRPNPIGLAVVRLVSCDAAAGRLDIDAIDCADGTPLIDIKPYYPGIDAFPGAMTGEPRD